MIILHAGLIGKKLLIWGECSPDVDAEIFSIKGKTPKIPKANPYPFDAEEEKLTEALETLSMPVKRERLGKINAWLPGKGRNPLPSSPMIAENPASKAKLKLAPWTITAYAPDSGEAVDLLCSCMGKRVLAPGIIPGNDLLWWADALKFAGALVAEQSYLPGILLENEIYRARWEPVFIGSSARELARLEKEMPPAARALLPEDVLQAPEIPAGVVLRAFLFDSLDYLVRFAVSGREWSEITEPKTSAFDSVHDAWTSALQTPDGQVHWDEIEILQLAARVREWQRPLTIQATSPFRLSFRLEEPKEIEEPENPDIQIGKADEVKAEREAEGEAEGVAEREAKGVAEGVAEREAKGVAEVKSEEITEEKEEKSSDLIEIPKGLWKVHYLLQPYDDPSLQVPVKNAWKPKKGSPLKKYKVQNIHQFLLSSLGQAAGISPGIAKSLETPDPDGYALDTKEAYEFLTDKALALSQAGFGVLLPSWWTGKGTKAHLQSRAKVEGGAMQAGAGLSLDRVISFDWELALGDRKLSVEELEALAELKAPLVKVRGQWVEVNDAEIRAAIEFWKKNRTSKTNLRDIVKMGLGVSEKASGVAFEGVEASGWIETLLRQLKERSGFEELRAPEIFSGTLRPYQVRGYSWLAFLRQWGLGACLADDMGLGKTVQTLALIQHDREEGPNRDAKKPVLLVCPTSVINNWKKEAARFTPGLSVMVHHGINRKKEKEFKEAAKEHALVVSSYGLLHRDLAFLKDISWAGVVLDEAQNVKNPETKQARAARSLQAEYRIALTGTPVENNVGDLWSLMEFLNPGFLGKQAEFKRNFFIPIQTGQDPEAADQLKAITGPFILRRLKTDKSIISDLPEKMEFKTYCTLTKEQASLYAAVLKDIEEKMEDTEGIQRKGLVLSALARLKQVCNHPAQFLKDNSGIPGRSGKLARLTEMLEVVLENKEKALVFTQFAEMGKILKEHLQNTFGCEVIFLHGGVSRKQRDLMIERFQAKEEYLPIFVLSLKAGGTGLNLTGANHVFHFDRWWNPAVENQATDRAFRIGQEKNVEVHKFICAGTLEEKIDDIIERKVEVAENVVGTGEGWLTEMSNEELKDLFALRKEAVED